MLDLSIKKHVLGLTCDSSHGGGGAISAAYLPFHQWNLFQYWRPSVEAYICAAFL